MKKQILIAWLCLAALAGSNCKPSHTADQVDNANKAAQYTIDMEQCYQDAVETVQTTQDYDKAQADYQVCAANAWNKAHQ